MQPRVSHPAEYREAAPRRPARPVGPDDRAADLPGAGGGMARGVQARVRLRPQDRVRPQGPGFAMASSPTRAGSRCTEHARESHRSRPNARYSTRAWQRLSARVLRAWPGEHGDWRAGYQRPAHPAVDLTVDHVVPLAGGGAPGACAARKGRTGAPDRIRTCDLRLRRPTLYPLSYRRARLDHTGRGWIERRFRPSWSDRPAVLSPRDRPAPARRCRASRSARHSGRRRG